MYVSYNTFVVLNVIRGNLGEKKNLARYRGNNEKQKQKHRKPWEHWPGRSHAGFSAHLLGGGGKNQLLEEVNL